ncbi:MAG TPA: TetR/AcrR family transcriptional regulator [Mycobacteriales bacterium]|nr:TetR/AcrR family transcriptional regulator [Mycobacteriales bacterium]
MTSTGVTKPSRKEQILEIALGLFAARGYHAVSVDDVGAAAGVTGPALYHHFSGKEDMLVQALEPVSQRLLRGAQHIATEHADDALVTLGALVEFHVGFALENPAIITLHLHELERLPADSRQVIRRTQRRYVERWVDVLCELTPGKSRDTGRAAALAAFGLMNSTPFLLRSNSSAVGSGELRSLLCAMALSALTHGRTS